MSDLIIKENMERQISEMWDAVNHIPSNEPDRDEAINQANKTEADLRELYRKQEALRDAAPELLLICKNFVALWPKKQRAVLSERLISVIKRAEEIIKKAESCQ
jgi:type VI protein secretion system component VasF